MLEVQRCWITPYIRVWFVLRSFRAVRTMPSNPAKWLAFSQYSDQKIQCSSKCDSRLRSIPLGISSQEAATHRLQLAPAANATQAAWANMFDATEAEEMVFLKQSYTLIAMASNLVGMASKLIGTASKLIGTASNLIAVAFL